MVNEKFVKAKLAELDKVDVNNNNSGYDLQYFYGILEVIYAEAYNEGIKLDGIYKQFADKYRKLSNARSDNIMQQFEEDLVVCDRILKIL